MSLGLPQACCCSVKHPQNLSETSLFILEPLQCLIPYLFHVKTQTSAVLQSYSTRVFTLTASESFTPPLSRVRLGLTFLFLCSPSAHRQGGRAGRRGLLLEAVLPLTQPPTLYFKCAPLVIIKKETPVRITACADRVLTQQQLHRHRVLTVLETGQW